MCIFCVRFIGSNGSCSHRAVAECKWLKWHVKCVANSILRSTSVTATAAAIAVDGVAVDCVAAGQEMYRVIYANTTMSIECGSQMISKSSASNQESLPAWWSQHRAHKQAKQQTKRTEATKKQNVLAHWMSRKLSNLFAHSLHWLRDED